MLSALNHIRIEFREAKYINSQHSCGLPQVYRSFVAFRNVCVIMQHELNAYRLFNICDAKYLYFAQRNARGIELPNSKNINVFFLCDKGAKFYLANK